MSTTATLKTRRASLLAARVTTGQLGQLDPLDEDRTWFRELAASCERILDTPRLYARLGDADLDALQRAQAFAETSLDGCSSNVLIRDLIFACNLIDAAERERGAFGGRAWSAISRSLSRLLPRAPFVPALRSPCSVPTLSLST